MARSRLTDLQFKDEDVISHAEHEAEPHYFTNNLDVPATYSGHAGDFLFVGATESGLEYITQDDLNYWSKTGNDLHYVGDIEANNYYLDPNPNSDGASSGDITTMMVDTNSNGVAAALYMASDGNFEEATASGAGTMPCMALALESGTGNKKILLKGFMRNDSWNWISIGQPVYVSTVAGVLTQTVVSGTGEQHQVVGIVTNADRILFNPNYSVTEIP